MSIQNTITLDTFKNTCTLIHVFCIQLHLTSLPYAVFYHRSTRDINHVCLNRFQLFGHQIPFLSSSFFPGLLVEGLESSVLVSRLLLVDLLSLLDSLDSLEELLDLTSEKQRSGEKNYIKVIVTKSDTRTCVRMCLFALMNTHTHTHLSHPPTSLLLFPQVTHH